MGGNDEIVAGLSHLRAYWEGRARARLPDLEKLEWSHRRTQRLRFESFLLDHDLRETSILDVGCGLGDFYAHLQQRGIVAEYTGYDLAAGMIHLCRARFPDVEFHYGDFLDYRPAGRFDYTVAFGIHNIRVAGALALLEAVTRHQFELARIAAHVSLLADRHMGFAAHIQAWGMEEVLNLALRVTPYVALHHDYLETDFSITLYHAPRYASRPDLFLDYDYE